MASTICITENCVWYLSNRGFARALDEIADALAASQACPALFTYLNNQDSIMRCVGNLELSELSAEERAAFLEATRQACQRLEERDPTFREHMLDLVALLESPRDTTPDPTKPRDPNKRPNAI